MHQFESLILANYFIHILTSNRIKRIDWILSYHRIFSVYLIRIRADWISGLSLILIMVGGSRSIHDPNKGWQDIQFIPDPDVDYLAVLPDFLDQTGQGVQQLRLHPVLLSPVAAAAQTLSFGVLEYYMAWFISWCHAQQNSSMLDEALAV